MKIRIENQAEMKKFATYIGKKLQEGDILILKGCLGVGKTFFCSSLINSLQTIIETVASPTFNIVSHYKTTKGQINHFDLYRIKNAAELTNINFREVISSGINLIEWPEIVENILPDNILKIEIYVEEEIRFIETNF